MRDGEQIDFSSLKSSASRATGWHNGGRELTAHSKTRQKPTVSEGIDQQGNRRDRDRDLDRQHRRRHGKQPTEPQKQHYAAPAVQDRIARHIDQEGQQKIPVPLALALGIISVQQPLAGQVDSGVSLAMISMPEFIIGYLVMFVFAVKMSWASSLSLINNGMGLGEKLQAIALPVTVLAFAVLAHMMRMTRAAILNVMESPYVETAELKGLTGFQVIVGHALPNAIVPIVNVVMLNLAYLVVGVVVVEVVFVYLGMGQYLVDHVSKRDVPVVQAAGLIFANVYIILNTAADLIAIVGNPAISDDTTPLRKIIFS